MLQHDLIRPSFSPWASPVVLVKKKDGSQRFCVDYRKLNAVTRKDTYPLPLISSIFDRMGKAKIFSTIDLHCGYWQFGIKEEDKMKTAFTDGHGLYEFNVLPFGLTGAPPLFQRGLDFLFMDVNHVVVYIDDIIIFSETFEEHLYDVEKVLERLEAAGLKIKPSKCDFGKIQVSYVGHTISKDGLKPNDDNISKIKNCAIPKNIKQLQQFLGLAGYYRRFIKNFSHIANPLNSLLRKGNKFIWN